MAIRATSARSQGMELRKRTMPGMTPDAPTSDNFGGTPTAEYGPIVVSVYPRVPTALGTTQGIIEVFHNTLPNNPCPA